MIKKITLLAILFLCIYCSKDEGAENPVTNLEETEFIKTFGGSKNDVFQSVVKTDDGGYAILGYTQSNDFDITDKPNESFDFWLMKFSSEDILLWQKTFGGTKDDYGYKIIQATDGGYVIVGSSKSDDFELRTARDH